MLFARTPKRALVIHALPTFIIFLALMMVTIFLTAILSLLAMIRLENSLIHPNPLVAYEAFWPGQSITSIVNDTYQIISSTLRCYSPMLGDSGYPAGIKLDDYIKLISPYDKLSCLGNTPDDIFHSIRVDIQDERVQQLDLFSDILQEDTLLLYWGAPDAIQRGTDGRYIYLRWNCSTYIATASIPANGSVVSFLSLVSVS